MKRFKAQKVYLVLMLILSVITGSLSGFESSALAAATAAPVNLGAAAPFGVFGGPFGMTNQGTFTVVNGDIGTTGAATLVTGFHDTKANVYTETPSNTGLVNGTIYTSIDPPGSVAGLIATAAAGAAQTAFDNMSPGLLPNGTIVPSENLGSLTLYPGVYTSASGSFIIQGGDLTLDALGDPNAVWVFQMSTGTLLVGGPGAAAPQSIILAGNAQAKNVFWQVGSYATINAGGGGTMVGTIIASAGAAFSTPGNVAIVTLNGRALGLHASVTLVNTVINVPAATSPQPASVSSAVPVNAATGVAINDKLSVTFSGAMDPATISTATFSLKQGLVPVSGAVTYSGVTAVFTPTSILAQNAVYTATITTGAKGLTGNALARDFVWSFTTGAATDIIYPTVISTVPANAGTAAPTGSKLTATFSEAMDPATISGTTFVLKDGANAVSGTVAYSGVTAIFTPASALSANTVYTATVTTGAKDLAAPGNAVASDFVWSFTTGTATDVIKPAVVLLNPADAATGVPVGSKFAATFSKAMDPLTITVETFTLQQGATAVSGTVNYSGVLAVFTPMSDLAANTVYTATISTGVKDLSGNAVASNYVWSFTTKAATLPVSTATLTSSPLTSQTVGQPVQFTATGTGGGGTPEYQFWVNVAGTWTSQPWTTNPVWTWNTTGLSVGYYPVSVYVRNVGSLAQYEAWKSVNFALVNVPVSTATLTSSPLTSQTVGQPVQFTATGTGGGGTPEYQFWVNVAGAWTSQPWTTNPVWTWNTTGLSVGYYPVSVYARNVGSSAQYEAWKMTAYQLQ